MACGSDGGGLARRARPDLPRFPLHPAKKPSTARAAHLADVCVPMLFLQGTRDALAEHELIARVVGQLGCGRDPRHGGGSRPRLPRAQAERPHRRSSAGRDGRRDGGVDRRGARAGMKIATFNVNDVNKRLANLLAWLAEAQPDVVCLQELEADQDRFPEAALRDAGYAAVWRGLAGSGTASPSSPRARLRS